CTSTRLFDHHLTPFGPMSRVEVQAHVLSGLLAGRVPVELPGTLQLLLCVALGAALALLERALGARAAVAGGLAAVAATLLWTWHVAFPANVYPPVVALALTAVLS